MLLDYFLRLALIVIVCMTMVRPSSANTYSVLYSDANQLCDGAVPATTHILSSPSAVLAAFTATFPRTCYVGGVLHYTQYANYFNLTSNTSLTYDIPAIPANQYTSGSAAVYGVVKTWAENVVNCPAAGTLYANGYFNIGTVPTGRMLNTACVSSCSIELISGVSPAATQVVSGVKYYYGRGKYNHTGQSCTPDTPNFLADFVGTLPNSTCAAGQQMISMNGVTKCFNSNGTEANLNSASSVAAAQTAGASKAASAVAAAQTAAQAAGLSASAVESAQAVAAGLSGSSGGSGTPANSDPVMAQFCQDNPTASICVEQDFGTVEDTALGEKNISVAITPVSVGGAGVCPAPTPITIHGQTRYTEWTTYCNFSTGIKPIILAFAWLSAAGLLVGGFRT